ncbi:helix-turn-helix domain-containing protein [Streptomyces dangxiongensis]|uniref:Helix-turn-helix domain-containing protein n=1 Tax=Streptomyces dangxiongensis TaxID=1442032 RepID=A0A3G2JQT0_9ACTN|nr:helix-turn-helix domain-containing protein [Streptomyces dangxiongensis]AYN37685.1 helix-turn-helix domain-containing protein [Streptomyces dangxiongensis]AYN43382.1 helix-turn-helix domain-containing protein [Streptomyces dangxiongensis]
MLLTTGQAAEEIGCAITTLRRLVQAGLLPGLSRRGVRVMIPLETVQALRERSHAPLHQLEAPEVAVLRVDTAQPAHEPGRDWLGFASSLTPEDLLKALRGWWRCDAASVAAGGVLPVTLSGYVVAVLTGLERWEKNTKGRHAFPDARLAGYVTDLATPKTVITSGPDGDRRLAKLLLGTRLASHSGGAVAYVTTHTAG